MILRHTAGLRWDVHSSSIRRLCEPGTDNGDGKKSFDDKKKNEEIMSTTQVLGALVTTSIASFLIRIYYPMGTSLFGL